MGFKNCFSYLCISNGIREILKYSLCTGETSWECCMLFSTPGSCALLRVAMHAKHSIGKDTAAVNRSSVRN